MIFKHLKRYLRRNNKVDGNRIIPVMLDSNDYQSSDSTDLFFITPGLSTPSRISNAKSPGFLSPVNTLICDTNGALSPQTIDMLAQNILNSDLSKVIVDYTGKLYENTSSELKSKGFKVKRLAFNSQENSDEYVGWNPLNHLYTGSNERDYSDFLVLLNKELLPDWNHFHGPAFLVPACGIFSAFVKMYKDKQFTEEALSLFKLHTITKSILEGSIEHIDEFDIAKFDEELKVFYKEFYHLEDGDNDTYRKKLYEEDLPLFEKVLRIISNETPTLEEFCFKELLSEKIVIFVSPDIESKQIFYQSFLKTLLYEVDDILETAWNNNEQASGSVQLIVDFNNDFYDNLDNNFDNLFFDINMRTLINSWVCQTNLFSPIVVLHQAGAFRRLSMEPLFYGSSKPKIYNKIYISSSNRKSYKNQLKDIFDGGPAQKLSPNTMYISTNFGEKLFIKALK